MFKWTKRKNTAAILLAQGYTEQKTADSVGVTRRTIANWKADNDFMLEVDKLTLMTGIALRSERLRIAARAIRQKVTEEKVATRRDLLDWLKYAQGETDGIKVDFGALLSEINREVAD